MLTRRSTLGVLLCLPVEMRRWRGLVTMRTQTRPLRSDQWFPDASSASVSGKCRSRPACVLARLSLRIRVRGFWALPEALLAKRYR